MVCLHSKQPNVPAMKALLNAGADPNIRSNGQSALFWATRSGSVGAIEALVQAGARMTRDAGGRSPITAAALLGNRAALEALAAAGPEQYEGSAEVWAELRALLGWPGTSPRSKPVVAVIPQQEDSKTQVRPSSPACWK